MPSAVERAWTSLFNAARKRRLASTISMVLASHTVQVTIEAKARPINTAFTTTSALRYMPQGVRSRGSVAVATTLSCASDADGSPSHAMGTVAPATAALNLHGLRERRACRQCLFQSSISADLFLRPLQGSTVLQRDISRSDDYTTIASTTKPAISH